MAKDFKRLAEKQNGIDSEIQRILVHVSSFFEQNIHPAWVKGYKDYLLYTMDRAMQIKDFQTNIKSPLVKRAVDSVFATIYSNNISFRITPRSKEDMNKAEGFKWFIDWAFSKGGSYNNLMESIKEGVTIGQGFASIGMVDDRQTIEIARGKRKIKVDLSGEVYPIVRYVPAFNLYYDPTIQKFADATYVIERRIEHKSQIVKQFKTLIPDIETKVAEAQKNPYYFSLQDNNRIKLTALWNVEQVSHGLTALAKSFNGMTRAGLFDIYLKNFLTVNYEGGFSEVIEYWEENRRVVIIDGTVVYEGDNPYPNKKIPYVSMQYGKVPGAMSSHGIATALSDIQDVQDTILNLSIDNMKMVIAPMFQKLRGGDVTGAGGSQTLDYSPFSVKEVNTDKGISRIELGIPDFTGINVLDYMNGIADMSEGLNAYSEGHQGKIERSAAGVNALVESHKARMLPFMDSINQALTRIGEFFGIIALTFLPDEIELRRIAENGDAEFKRMKLEDFMGRYDIEIDPRSIKAATRDLRKKQVFDMISLAAQTGTDPITGKPFIDMRELWKELLLSHEIPFDDVLLDYDEILELQKRARGDDTDMEIDTQNKMAQAQQQAQAGMQDPNAQNLNPEAGALIQEAQGGPVPEEEAMDPTATLDEQQPTTESDLMREAYQT